MPYVVSVPPEALAIRFKPIQPATLIDKAALEFRRAGHHGLSVYADVPRVGEDDHDVVARLLEASQLSGLDPARNKKFWVCARVGNLLEEGFVFMKDDYPGELAQHYCVSLGDNPSVETAERLRAAFNLEEVWKP